MEYLEKYNQRESEQFTGKGFSLIEVLFSLAVFFIGIVSILALMISNTKTEILSKDQLIASQLVQEGIELVRNLVDNEYVITPGQSYCVDYLVNSTDPSGHFSVAADNQSYRLYQKNGFFSHDNSGSPTKFYRKIEVSSPNAGQTLIRATVFWGDTAGVFPTVCNIGAKCETSVSIVSDILAS